MLVHHYDELCTFAPHAVQYRIQPRSLGNERHVAHDIVTQWLALHQEPQDVPNQHDADDLIERILVDRVARMSNAARHRSDFFGGGVTPEPYDTDPRRHDLDRGELTELEKLRKHRALFFLELAFRHALFDHEA